MTKLEVEYDYDTDAEQQKHSQRMLLHELSQAIEFYVRDEPIKLVDNVLLWLYRPQPLLLDSVWVKISLN